MTEEYPLKEKKDYKFPENHLQTFEKYNKRDVRYKSSLAGFYTELNKHVEKDVAIEIHSFLIEGEVQKARRLTDEFLEE